MELLGPSLYTNIYYVLAELIANAYDAEASNVYIIKRDDAIIVEDDGSGMSYDQGDIDKYLNVAKETRTDSAEVKTKTGKRNRMGRKGVGKLAALSVSENVLIMTRRDDEKSGFILSRHVNEDKLLQPIDEKAISFERVSDESDGTSVVMTKPEYGLHTTVKSIKRNLLKIFPMVNSDFRIHIVVDNDEEVIESFDEEIVSSLGALAVLGEEFHFLKDYFNPRLVGDNDSRMRNKLLDLGSARVMPIKLTDKVGAEKNYDLVIKGWIGVYKSTKGRKENRDDFTDNFISLFSNGKLGEYNILSIVGKNKLSEVFVVGQLHVDLFEETSLPDMALSNRQGYKTDDKRYEAVIGFVRDELLPKAVEMRVQYAKFKNEELDKSKREQQEKDEANLKRQVELFKTQASEETVNKLQNQFGVKLSEEAKAVVKKQMNDLMPVVGIKRKVDAQKRRILISHASVDKVLADIVYKMLLFNNVPSDEIIYTSSENSTSRIPNELNIYDYLREFFVESYSDQKIYVVYITSKEMASRWFPVTEVGAGWITRQKHEVFNLAGSGYHPDRPLNIDMVWHTSSRNGDNIEMSAVEFDRFVVKIVGICNYLGYTSKSDDDNRNELKRHASIV